MFDKPKYFDIEELVCPHVFYKFGETAFQFLDPRQLILIDWLRVKMGPGFVNNWHELFKDSDFIKYIAGRMKAKQPIVEADIPAAPKGLLDERGLRCHLCDSVKKKTKAGVLYASPHITAQADDIDFQGRLAEEVRQFLIKNRNILPFPIRIEAGVSWVHMDCRETTEKVFVFNP